MDWSVDIGRIWVRYEEGMTKYSNVRRSASVCEMRRGITTRAEQRKSDVRVIITYETTLSQKIKSKSKLCTHASSQLTNKEYPRAESY